MGWFDNIFSETTKGLVGSIGTAAKDLRTAITGKIPPEQRAELLDKMAALEDAVVTAQTEINKIELSSPRLFISGWRPFIGWVCGGGLAYQFILRPILNWVLILVFGDVPELPSIETRTILELTLGMLGLAGLRTYEKIRDVAKG